MGYFFNTLQTAYATAYSHGLKKKFTEPKIYHGGEDFDLSKRWYVYYSFEHPTKKDAKGNPVLKRPTSITLKVNQRYKAKKERLFHLQLIRDALNQMLKDGYSPYIEKVDGKIMTYTAESALDFAFDLKKSLLSETSIRDYRSRLGRFKGYLKEHGLLQRNILDIDKKVVNGHLNEIQKTSSARNRNNTKVVLGALFSVLEDNEIILQESVLLKKFQYLVQGHAIGRLELSRDRGLDLYAREPLVFKNFIHFWIKFSLIISRLRRF